MVAPGTALSAAAFALSASAPVRRVSSLRWPPAPRAPPGAPAPGLDSVLELDELADGSVDGSAVAGRAVATSPPARAPAAIRPAAQPIRFRRFRPAESWAVPPRDRK